MKIITEKCSDREVSRVRDEIRSQEKMRKEKDKGKGFCPERHAMVFCPNCSGSGRYFYASKGASVCEVCGGFGLVRKEDIVNDASIITGFGCAERRTKT